MNFSPLAVDTSADPGKWIIGASALGDSDGEAVGSRDGDVPPQRSTVEWPHACAVGLAGLRPPLRQMLRERHVAVMHGEM